MVRSLQSVGPLSSIPPPPSPFKSPQTALKQSHSLAPKYEELAELYTSDPTFNTQVTIAKVDATANDVPDEVSGFPTIKLFPAGSKDSPITYSGSRTIEDLANFVKENGKFKVDVYEGKAGNETEDGVDEGEGLVGKAAEAATEKVKEAAEAAKTMAAGDGEADGQEHDEL